MRSGFVMRTLMLATWGLFIGGAIALAAPPVTKTPAAQKPATPRPNPIVTIKKTDGTTVRGQLVSPEPDLLVIKPAGAAAENLTVRWKDIKSVSNGLTQEQAAGQWKELHKDELCPDCHGDRGIPCKDCHGTGFDQSKLETCKDCGGAGAFYCTNKKCDDGQIDCPAPCMKPSVGRWTKNKDGLRIRTFPGGAWVSEHHFGELFDTRGGAMTPLGKCTTCGGTTKVDCPECGGLAYKICQTCYFEGKTGPACPSCEDGRTPCTTCNGTGLKKA
jgi:hypothetical protein